MRRGRAFLTASVLLVLIFVLFQYSTGEGCTWCTVTSQVRSFTGLDGRENAVMFTLARNDDLEELLTTLDAFEARFNRRYHYDWVFLNNEDFSSEFRDSVSAAVSGKAKFGKIAPEHWSYPASIDLLRAASNRAIMAESGVPYAGSESYRHMCRFESGFFFKEPLLKPYRYYWRVEPGTKLLCDVDYDVFRYMRENELKYGFTISLTEFAVTIETLWNTTMQFLAKDSNSQFLAEDNLSRFVTDDDMRSYNLCHFWTNFEIADMEFWRGEAYQAYFSYLDDTGNYFYERWGDAPVHSIAASLFLKASEIHLFDDIGYRHPPFSHCPANQGLRELKCECETPDPYGYSNEQFDWHHSSCLRKYLDAKNVYYIDGNPYGLE